MKFVKAQPKYKFMKSSKEVSMNPKQFLDLSIPQKIEKSESRYDEKYYDKKSLSNLEKRMKKEEPIDPLLFDVEHDTHTIIGHEGRHRAYTAHKLGIKEVPVVLRFKRGFHYLEQCKTPYPKPKKLNLKPETFRRKHELYKRGYHEWLPP